MHHLTVRNIPMELATALEAEKKRRRRSPDAKKTGYQGRQREVANLQSQFTPG